MVDVLRHVPFINSWKTRVNSANATTSRHERTKVNEAFAFCLDIKVLISTLDVMS